MYAQRPGSGLYEFMLSGHNNYIKNTSSFKLLCTTTLVVIYCRATRGFIKLLCIRAALPPHTIVLQCFSQSFQLLRLSLQDIRMLFAINRAIGFQLPRLYQQLRHWNETLLQTTDMLNLSVSGVFNQSFDNMYHIAFWLHAPADIFIRIGLWWHGR